MKYVLFVTTALMLSAPAFAQDSADPDAAAKQAEILKREQDTSAAVALSEQMDAAQQGDVAAQYNLGMRYFKGDGVTQDYKSAAMWLRKASDAGDMDAQASLGTMFQKGTGVAQDDHEAFRLYIQAAQQGSHTAQYNLATMYASGTGTRQNDAEAYFWILLSGATMGGDNLDTLQSSLEGRLSEAQVAAIKKRADAWEPKVRDTQQLPPGMPQ